MACGSSGCLTAWSPETLEGPHDGLVDTGQEEPATPPAATLDDYRTRISVITDRDIR
jgi:hypothetical protein